MKYFFPKLGGRKCTLTLQTYRMIKNFKLFYNFGIQNLKKFTGKVGDNIFIKMKSKMAQEKMQHFRIFKFLS